MSNLTTTLIQPPNRIGQDLPGVTLLQDQFWSEQSTTLYPENPRISGQNEYSKGPGLSRIITSAPPPIPNFDAANTLAITHFTTSQYLPHGTHEQPDLLANSTSHCTRTKQVKTFPQIQY
ncbi:hypothetical protein PCANC_01340 [Puccinia coronata f. sp. avenae]|uniref:Uncharacterized protein n=1 Tax=Puccinia coronata f. sp. avenae TaxID=200324 RepID=A0A2N5W690_9BASI|nr:hypothetical protein PCANC_01340 [Puccinia coronata f. sp. avenae]